MSSFFIIAGEASGDMHAASLVRSLKSHSPGSAFTGIGGKEMRSAGVKTIYDLEEVNYIGFTSVARNFFSIRQIMRNTLRVINQVNPSALILVDFPGFNLRIAESVRRNFKGKIIYYISPQVWAWHKSRVKTMKKVIDELIVVFPFEVGFFRNEGMEAVYCGHPLVRRIDDFLSTAPRRASGKKVISMLPGSRKTEVEAILPEMLATADLLLQKYDCEIKVLCSPNLPAEMFGNMIGGRNVKAEHIEGDSNSHYETMLNSDLIITKSGTSTLECALIGTPFMVVYRTGPLNFLIGKALVNVKYISIVNILLGKPAVKEFLQSQMNSKNMFAESCRILDDSKYASCMVSEFAHLRKILGNEDAPEEAAKTILSAIRSGQ